MTELFSCNLRDDVTIEAIEEASHQSKHFNIEAFEKRNLEINTEAKKMQDFFLSL